MARWDKSARQELAPARHQSTPALHDELPSFLQSLEKGILKEGRSPHAHRVKNEQQAKAQSHGKERAKKPDYNLEQVLFEYHLLRDAIVDTLTERLVHISPRELTYIHTAIDRAMAAAAQLFADYRIQQEQVNVARLEAEKDLREKFVSTLTHDLRTPLSAILMSAQLLLRQASQSEEFGQITRLTARILGSVERADHMIQDLLDANRIQAGEKLPIQIGASDLRAIATLAVEEATSLYGDRIVLEAKDSIRGYWCSFGMRRAIENLISNAVKYGDPRQKIAVKAWQAAPRAFVSVHNFGNPIPANDQKEIFRQFGRGRSAQSGDQKGWGLGLTLVQGIAEAHGGSVALESSPGTGTTFTITVPIDARQ